jgi:itaconyl-CoA hydratase
MTATREANYFEAFAVGDIFEHRRGRTLSQDQNARWSLLTLNTAQSHWNVDSMRSYLGGQFDKPIVNAAVVLAIAVGLTSQDMSENAFLDIGLDRIRMTKALFADDTVTARSTVVDVTDSLEYPHCGRLDYSVELMDQRGDVVCTFIRSILVKRRSHWQERDREFAAAYWPDVSSIRPGCAKASATSS